MLHLALHNLEIRFQMHNSSSFNDAIYILESFKG